MGIDILFTQTLTGTSNYSGTVQAPVDGYRGFAQSVNTGLQQLINNDVYFSQNDIRNTDQVRQVSLSSAGFYIDHSILSGSGWRYNSTTYRLEQTMITGPQYYFIVDLPYDFNNIAYIKQIDVLVIGAGGHSGLPSGMPHFVLQRDEMSTGAITQFGIQFDTSPTLSDYINYHLITKTFASGNRLRVDNNLYRTSLVFKGESGTNAINGLLVCSVKITYTATLT